MPFLFFCRILYFSKGMVAKQGRNRLILITDCVEKNAMPQHIVFYKKIKKFTKNR